ncbi:MAG: DUF1905 domain-containing protein [Bacteroidota bacterium]
MQFEFTQHIGQLEKRKGGYYYLTIDADTVNQFEKKRHTRLVCTIDHKVSYSCGLNHLGDGNFFIILSTARLKKLGKELGDEVHFSIKPDPNPLGVEVPEVLTVLLQQDEAAKGIYDQLTDGKKRSLIFQIKPVKNIDLQVEKALQFLEGEAEKLRRKKAKS